MHAGRGAHDEQHFVGGAEAFLWLGLVLAVLPGGVVLDVFDGHVAHHAIAARDGHGQTGKGHQGIGEAGVGFAPDKGLHAAHGGAEDQAQVIDVQTFEQHAVLRADHVVVVVAREAHVEAVRGPGAFALTYVVGKNQEVVGDIEWLPGAEKNGRELRRKERPGVAASAMEQQHRVVDVPPRVTVWRAQREVVQVQRRQGLARAEAEVGEIEVARLACVRACCRGWRTGWGRDGRLRLGKDLWCRKRDQSKGYEKSQHCGQLQT